MSEREMVRARRVYSMEYQAETHLGEFTQVVDSLGRIWDALKHPRDRMGRFIRTFSNIKFNMPGETNGEPYAAVVEGIDPDGTLTGKITGAPKGGDASKVGQLIKLKQKDVDVQTIKAKLGGRGAAGKLNTQEARVIQNRIKALEGIGLDKQAKDLSEALDIAMEQVADPTDPAAQARKDSAIEKFRAIGEELDDIRGEGFKEGQSLDDVKADLTKEEKNKLEVLRESIEATFTARHSMGDKRIDVQSSDGAVPAKGNERRLGAGQGRIQANYAKGTEIWDGTGDTLTKATLQAPQVQAPIGDASTPQNENVISALRNFTYQKLRSGLNRSAGYRQAARVAPGDRWTVDKNGDQVIPSATVMYTPARGGEPVVGMVTNVALDANGNQTVTVRRYDPEYQLGNTNSKGKPLPYKDHRGITSDSIELADEDQQHTIFKGLSLQGETGRLLGDQMATALAEDAIAKLQAEAGRRYAESGAKRTSPLGAIDAIPMHERVRKGANGEMIGIGDHVVLEGGLPGVVTSVANAVQKSGTGTLTVMYPDGQVSDRITSAKFTKLHDATHEVSPGTPSFNDGNYVPTREEAASLAEGMGAPDVAKVIRDGGDMSDIQSAMSTDAGFQEALRATPDLDKKRETTLQAGQELSPEDQAELAKWTRMASASAGQFREPEDVAEAPTLPTAPEPESEGERPQNPANPSEHVSEGGTSVREEGEQTIVDDNVNDPIDSGDTEAVEQAVADADSGEAAEPTEEPGVQTGVAHRVLNDLNAAASDLQFKDSIQEQNVTKRLRALDAAIKAEDGEAFVNGLKDLTGIVNKDVNRNLRGSRLHGILNKGGGNGRPLHELMQQRLDAGDNLFGGAPVQRAERQEEVPTETPDGVQPEVDDLDASVAEAALSDDGSIKIMQGDQQVDEGFYVANQNTVTNYPEQPTAQDITDFLEATDGSDGDGVSISYDEATGQYTMSRVGLFDNDQDAADAARATEANQYVDIATGQVYNVALDGDPDAPAESVEDPRSEERTVRTAGKGKAAARSTSKQKTMLDHVAGVEGADPEISRITEAVKNGEEISGADASRLADHIDGLDVGQFEKPSDKGVASQLAHKLARAAGEEGARGYSSAATALRRTSDVGIGLSASSGNDEVRDLVQAAREDIKTGDMQAAADKFRQAADLYDEEGNSRTQPSDRAREHADRLEAMGGVTGPAPERVAEPAPATPTETVPESEDTTPIDTPPPTPPAEGEAPGGAPEPESVDSALGSAESYLESEVQAEGDNGPQGWSNELEDVNNMISGIRDRKNDDTLADDLRELADAIEDNFRLTDGSPAANELRQTADSLGAPAEGGEAPAGGVTADKVKLSAPERKKLETEISRWAEAGGETGEAAAAWLGSAGMTGDQLRELAHQVEATRELAGGDTSVWDSIVESLYDAAGAADEASGAVTSSVGSPDERPTTGASTGETGVPVVASNLDPAFLENVTSTFKGTVLDDSRNKLGDLAPAGAPLHTKPRGDA